MANALEMDPTTFMRKAKRYGGVNLEDFGLVKKPKAEKKPKPEKYNMRTYFNKEGTKFN